MHETNIKDAIYTVWNYLKLNQPLPTYVDVMIILGNRDERTVDAAFHTLTQVDVGDIVITGGAVPPKNELSVPVWPEGSEAAHFATILKDKGLRRELILESKAQNTGDNAIFSEKILKERHIDAKSILIVTKPYMERRALQTFRKQWGSKQTSFYVASIGGSFDEYLNNEQTADIVTNIMVGDLQRIIDYPAKGFMESSEVPDEVLAALDILKRAGFTKHI